MKISFLFYIVLLLNLGSAEMIAQKLTPVAKVISQINSPIKITAYEASYSGRGSSYVREGIHHKLDYENTSTKTIVAVQFGLVSFDIWNEYLDRMGGITMKSMVPASKSDGEWIATAYGDFSFQTGVAYVSKVRFEDGEIWTADLAAVLIELKKIEKDFDASRLKKKEEGK